ncbi:hypothetical protein [Serratia rubidaea]|nr:hypothetical protein [Serratia rubidaea]MBD8451661.1 hypothetical protein [Serratia rubidaea]
MQTGMVIKWGHRLLTVVLLILVTALGGYLYVTTASYDDILYSKKQLTDEMWLYITQYQRAGATDSEVYRYYLNRDIREAPLAILEQNAPFLTADRPDAVVKGDGNRVSINFTGKVYSFTNSAFFYGENNAVPMMPTLDFSAQGVNAWR